MTFSSSSPTDNSSERSALEDNISRKGKNSYYFAHAHKATGPKWDGKIEPKLLSTDASSTTTSVRASVNSSFEYHKSNISKYSFLDEGMKVKLYIEMEGVGEKCTDDNIAIEFTENSLCLTVSGYNEEEDQCLSFARLTAPITKAVCKKKPNRLILILTKKEQGEWHTVNDKG